MMGCRLQPKAYCIWNIRTGTTVAVLAQLMCEFVEQTWRVAEAKRQPP